MDESDRARRTNLLATLVAVGAALAVAAGCLLAIVTYAADGAPGGTGQDEDLRVSEVATWRTVTEPSP